MTGWRVAVVVDWLMGSSQCADHSADKARAGAASAGGDDKVVKYNHNSLPRRHRCGAPVYQAHHTGIVFFVS